MTDEERKTVASIFELSVCTCPCNCISGHSGKSAVPAKIMELPYASSLLRTVAAQQGREYEHDAQGNESLVVRAEAGQELSARRYVTRQNALNQQPESCPLWDI